MPPEPEPDWLATWRHGGLDRTDALERFDALEGLEPEAMLGRWRGTGLHTGHVFDGVLEGLGWWGKGFESIERVHPLLFDTPAGVVPLEPAFMPVALTLRWPWILPRSDASRWLYRRLRPLLRTGQPGARLERRTLRGRTSAAMVYLRQPIVDHFRRIDEGRVLGLMEMTGMEAPFFFLLEREDGGAAWPSCPGDADKRRIIED